MRLRRRLLLALAIPACAAPPPVEPPAPRPAAVEVPARAPEPDRPAPEPTDTVAGPVTALRVGLELAPAVPLGAAGSVRVSGPAGTLLGIVPARGGWQLVPGGDGVRLVDAAGQARATEERMTIVAGDGALVAVGAAPYRGALEVFPAAGGLQVVNAVGLEDYLPGVVAAEIGNRTPAEREAVLAQAIVARTYALRNLARWAARGYDLEAGTGDQVYRGVAGELPLATEAVHATRGLVLTWAGAPIDAFFSSTCGGDTEDGAAVFAAAERPYLVGGPDRDPSGRAWCADSPRFRWSERWGSAELEAALRSGLPTVGLRAPAGAPQDVSVAARTSSGRVRALAVRYVAANVTVEGQNPVRRALLPPGGGLLRSARFTLEVRGRNGRLEALVAEGAGAGHGVGLCQWGAIGRARAGQRHDEILAAYYPGTTLVRWY